MADIAATDVVVTVEKQNIVRGSPGGLRFNIVKLVFGDGALTYNTGGVPVPAAAKFGMMKKVDCLIIIQNSLAAVKYQWTYDFANQKLLGVEVVAGETETVGMTEIADATAIAAQTLYALAIGW